MSAASRLFAGVAALALAAVAPAAPRPQGAPAADMILTGGKVITVDPARPIAEAVAVRDGHIVAVGSAAEIASWRGKDTVWLTLKGRTVLPGFIDSHSHISGMANVEANYINVQVPPLQDGAAIIARLKEAQRTKARGAWLIGQGTYNQPMPTRAELDAAFPDTPVDLQWSVHDHLINHAAALAMGMTRAYPDPPAGSTGRYERTPDGEVMITRDAPVPLPAKAMSFAELKEGVRAVLDRFYLRKGVTTVSDLSEPDTFRAEQQLREEGRLPVRILANYWAKLFGDGESAIVQTGLFTGFGDDWLRLAAIKVPVDGVWGTTAAVYKPFWKGSGTTWIPDNVGGTTFTQEALDRVVLLGHRAGWQVEAHANGDRAQDMILTAYERAQAAVPRADARDRIEHFGNFLVADDRTAARLARMVRDHIIPSPQPAFLWRLTDVNIQEPGVHFMALHDMIAQGLHPAGGIDTIGTQNYATYPLFSIARAVGRRTKYGRIVQPEQAISVMDGIRMFTIWAAEAGFLDKERGTIEVGKLADFAVLEADPLVTPPEKLPDIPVAMTIIGGHIAYERH